jgi:hypothetical protein
VCDRAGECDALLVETSELIDSVSLERVKSDEFESPRQAVACFVGIQTMDLEEWHCHVLGDTQTRQQARRGEDESKMAAEEGAASGFVQSRGRLPQQVNVARFRQIEQAGQPQQETRSSIPEKHIETRGAETQ